MGNYCFFLFLVFLNYFKFCVCAFFSLFFFQNRSINWDTKVPCLTSCLKETLIPSLPLIVLILFLVLDLRVIINLKGQCHKLPWRWRNITNLVSCFRYFYDYSFCYHVLLTFLDYQFNFNFVFALFLN